MASANIGPKIGITGEAQYRKAINDIITQTKTLSSEMRKLTSEYAKDDKSLEGNRKKRETLTQMIKKQEEALKEQTAMLEKSAEATGETSNQTEKWKQVVNNTQTEINNLNNQLKDLPSTLTIIGDKFQDVGKKMESVGRGMTQKLTMPIVAGFGVITKVTMDFDKSMSNVQALSGATGDEFDALRNKAIELGKTTAFTSSDVADAFSYMALAGWETEEMLEGIEGVLNLSASAGMDLAQASDIVTDYLSAFGLEASQSTKIADMFAYAQANANMTVEQLGEALHNSASNMNASSQTIQTTTALLEAMANQGNKGATAGTGLSAIMRDLTNKMEDGKVAINGVNVAIQDEEGNYRDLIDIIADVDSATQGLGDAQRNEALASIFTARSLPALNQVMNEGIDTVRGYRDELYASAGASEEMANIKLDNLSGQLTLLKSALEGLAIQLGDMLMPYIRQFVTYINEVVTWLQNLDPETQAMIMKIAGLVAIIGPLLLIVGKVITFVGTLMKAMAVIKTAIAGVGAVLGGISLPILAVIAGIVALVAVGKLLYDNWDIIKAKALELWTSMVETFNSIKEAVVTKFNEIVEGGRQMISNLANGILSGIGMVISAMTQIVTGIITTIGNFLTSMMDKGRDLIGKLGEGISTSAQNLWSKVQEIGRNIVDGVWSGIQSMIGTFTSNVSKFFGGIVDNVKNTLEISSPSKVFAQIGRYMGEGLELGWEKSLKGFNPSKDIAMRVPSVDAVAGIGALGNNYSFNPNITINGQYHERDGMNIAMSLDRWLGAQV